MASAGGVNNASAKPPMRLTRGLAAILRKVFTSTSPARVRWLSDVWGAGRELLSPVYIWAHHGVIAIERCAVVIGGWEFPGKHFVDRARWECFSRC